MTHLNLRLTPDIKSALGALPGSLSDEARAALGAHARAATLAAHYDFPVALVALLLTLANEMQHDANIDTRGDAMRWAVDVELAFQAIRSGETCEIWPFGCIPASIKKRAVAMTSALEN
jgi:hypothetical protein